MNHYRLLAGKRHFSCRNIILFAGILFCLSVSSCLPDTIDASYDSSHEYEGGPSGVINSQNFGYNIAANWMFGLDGFSKLSSAGDWTHTHAYTNDGIPAFDPADMADHSAPGSGQWQLASKLQFIQKGSKIDGSRTKLNYLEGVEDVRYKYNFADKSAIYGGLGPYIAYGIGGNVKGSGFKEAAFGGQDGYKRFDAGLHLAGGYQLPVGLYFGLAYELGLVDKSPTPDDYTSHNRTFSIEVGYPLDKIFKGLKKK
jgi:hypothetical protein